jgi:spore coat polysaccharide biosynthesis protein SpsF
MKTICGIQARMSSSRLPGKSLLPLGEETVIKRVYENVVLSNVFDNVLVLTSTDKTDDELCKYLNNEKIQYLRGSLNNVLSRYLDAIQLFDCSNVVRITGDNPLIDSKVIKDVVNFHIENNFDYSSNIINRLIPRGNDVECIKQKSLISLKNYELTKDELEHVTLFIRKNSKFFKVGSFEKDYGIENNDLRLTLDYEEDYELILKIYKELNFKNEINNLGKIDKLFTHNNELKRINSIVEQTKINKQTW